jgi:hypothetical protein
MPTPNASLPRCASGGTSREYSHRSHRLDQRVQRRRVIRHDISFRMLRKQVSIIVVQDLYRPMLRAYGNMQDVQRRRLRRGHRGTAQIGHGVRWIWCRGCISHR